MLYPFIFLGTCLESKKLHGLHFFQRLRLEYKKNLQGFRTLGGLKKDQDFFKVNSGKCMILPPTIADSWAKIPTQVILADCLASG